MIEIKGIRPPPRKMSLSRTDRDGWWVSSRGDLLLKQGRFAVEFDSDGSCATVGAKWEVPYHRPYYDDGPYTYLGNEAAMKITLELEPAAVAEDTL